MNETITNTITGAEIDNDNIVSESEGGIVYTNKTSWNFVPSKYIKKDEFGDDEYYPDEEPPEYEQDKLEDDYLDDENNVDKYYTEKANYEFGFKIMNTKSYNEAKNSVIVSDFIDLETFSYITIEAEEEAEEDSVIEYSILSGTQEIPIIPENNTRAIIKEKMFYGLDTRFVIDQSTATYIIYEDGIKTSKTSPSFKNFEEHEYVIKYKAGGDPFKVIPPQNKIRIKVVIRNSGKVNNIILKKHGGSLQWN